MSFTVHKDVMSADQVTVAVNRILHGPAYLGRLILPVIRR